jgi:hypothetical protein
MITISIQGNEKSPYPALLATCENCGLTVSGIWIIDPRRIGSTQEPIIDSLDDAKEFALRIYRHKCNQEDLFEKNPGSKIRMT